MNVESASNYHSVPSLREFENSRDEHRIGYKDSKDQIICSYSYSSGEDFQMTPQFN